MYILFLARKFIFDGNSAKTVFKYINQVDTVTVEITQASKIGYSTSKNAVETACAWAQFMSKFHIQLLYMYI
jgi:hypothetical protein